MDNTFGYVTSYTKNSDGTFTCSLVSNTTGDRKFLTPSNSDFPLSTNFNTPTATTSIKCVGILNSNVLISPNNPAQIIIMSNDNKYIFIPFNNGNIKPNNIIQYYLMTYSILKYNTKIPLYYNVEYLIQYVMSPKFTSTDSTYNSLPKSFTTLFYAAYLTGMNPPDVLLKINSDVTVWSDVGYYYFSIYNFLIGSQKIDPKYEISSNKILKKNGILPDNICISTDSPAVIPAISEYDCRNVPKGTPYIIKEHVENASMCGSSSSFSSSLSSITLIGLLVFSGIAIAKTIDKKRN